MGTSFDVIFCFSTCILQKHVLVLGVEPLCQFVFVLRILPLSAWTHLQFLLWCCFWWLSISSPMVLVIFEGPILCASSPKRLSFSCAQVPWRISDMVDLCGVCCVYRFIFCYLLVWHCRLLWRIVFGTSFFVSWNVLWSITNQSWNWLISDSMFHSSIFKTLFVNHKSWYCGCAWQCTGAGQERL